jgi:hypothetical protein
MLDAAGYSLQALTWRLSLETQQGGCPGLVPTVTLLDHLYPNVVGGVVVPNMPETDIAAVCERLRADGVDVVRVSYPDLIGVDRGRDVLLGELPAAAGHGLAFCRAVYHTSPMGDVVPVQGGLEAGLPDITVRPDLSTLTPLPWEPHAAWCLGDATTAGGRPPGRRSDRRPRVHHGLRS